MSQNIKLILASFLLICRHEATAQQRQVPKLASRDEYRSCLEELDKLKPQRVLLKEWKNSHDHKLKLLQDEMNALVATQASVDTSDEEAVNGFNEQMESLNKKGEELNENSKKFNETQNQFNAQIAATNKRCAAIIISYEDMKLVNKERAKKK